MDTTYDVVVVGGGASGLSAALTLSRARRSVLVVDAGSPRNAPAGHVHNYLGREGSTPGELLATGRDEVRSYGGQVTTGEVVSARREDEVFQVALADGRTMSARRLLVTTGLVDELPDVPGVAERWGSQVLHCPYCHGWEVRDQRLVVLATSPMSLHQALLFRQWSPHVTVLLHDVPSLTDEQREQLSARDIAVVQERAVGLEGEGKRLSGLRLAGGDLLACDAVVVAPRFTARTSLLASLGVEVVEMVHQGHLIGSHVSTDVLGATSVPGVWAAGNVTDLHAQVVVAAGAGLMAGAAVNADLVAEDTRLAVEALREAGGAQAASGSAQASASIS